MPVPEAETSDISGVNRDPRRAFNKAVEKFTKKFRHRTFLKLCQTTVSYMTLEQAV